jgi:hypothetical protein
LQDGVGVDEDRRGALINAVPILVRQPVGHRACTRVNWHAKAAEDLVYDRCTASLSEFSLVRMPPASTVMVWHTIGRRI